MMSNAVNSKMMRLLKDLLLTPESNRPPCECTVPSEPHTKYQPLHQLDGKLVDLEVCDVYSKTFIDKPELVNFPAGYI